MIKEEYEKYLNESSKGSSSSQELSIPVKQWKSLPKAKVIEKQAEKQKEKFNEDFKPTNNYFSNCAIDAEINLDDNHVPEASKHSDDSTLTQDNNDLMNDQVEGEPNFEGERERMDVDVKGEHQNIIPIVVGEEVGNNTNVSNDQTDAFHDINENISNAGEGSETEEMFEDSSLDFDPAYPPMDRWIKSHPKEQVLGDPHEGVLTRAQLHAKNEKRHDKDIAKHISTKQKKNKKQRKLVLHEDSTDEEVVPETPITEKLGHNSPVRDSPSQSIFEETRNLYGNMETSIVDTTINHGEQPKQSTPEQTPIIPPEVSNTELFKEEV
ncbi:unnamed protein product [Lactuca saligna]|uniref:Uncharacterized protein n=1 Tax=Lactuca saligna TaxID=75948 RepID=A0AA36EGR0_LACSI|nr:unnamed protein product [Lactuca saligna]